MLYKNKKFKSGDERIFDYMRIIFFQFLFSISHSKKAMNEKYIEPIFHLFPYSNILND